MCPVRAVRQCGFHQCRKYPRGGIRLASLFATFACGKCVVLTGLFLTQRDKKRERELESIIPVSLISRGRGSPLLNADPDKFCSKRELPMQYDFRVGGLSSKQTERLWPRSGRGSK